MVVYPRWRGEHKSQVIVDFTLNVLSPLARGTRAEMALTACLTRFIPAGAGNTFFQFRRSFLDPVYPRWRGEHMSAT